MDNCNSEDIPPISAGLFRIEKKKKGGKSDEKGIYVD